MCLFALISMNTIPALSEGAFQVDCGRRRDYLRRAFCPDASHAIRASNKRAGIVSLSLCVCVFTVGGRMC